MATERDRDESQTGRSTDQEGDDVSEALRISPLQQLLNKICPRIPSAFDHWRYNVCHLPVFPVHQNSCKCSQLLILRKYRQMTGLNGLCGQEQIGRWSMSQKILPPKTLNRRLQTDHPINAVSANAAVWPLDPEK